MRHFPVILAQLISSVLGQPGHIHIDSFASYKIIIKFMQAVAESIIRYQNRVQYSTGSSADLTSYHLRSLVTSDSESLEDNEETGNPSESEFYYLQFFNNEGEDGGENEGSNRGVLSESRNTLSVDNRTNVSTSNATVTLQGNLPAQVALQTIQERRVFLEHTREMA